MTVQELRNLCNNKYSQAIEGMEQGKAAAQVARLLLDAAECLVEIGRADISKRVECERKARLLLSAARVLRESGSADAAYRMLMGKALPQPAAAFPTVFAMPHPAEVDDEDDDKIDDDDVDDEDEEEDDDDEEEDEEEDDIVPSPEPQRPSKPVGLEDAERLLREASASWKRPAPQPSSAGALKGYKFAWDELPKISFSDVAGLGDVKEVVMRKVLLPLMNPHLYEGYVKKNGGGVLLYGPPGTGKTMVAAAIAHEIGAKFCTVGPSDLVLGGIGNSEKAVVALFKEARSFPCSVIFFDEMESICPVTTQAQGARQLRSELLRQIQGMEAYGEQNDHILFLIAATNKPWDIDPAFVRPGRFGTRIYVGLPDEEARRYMIENRLNKIQSSGKVRVHDIDIDDIVERTEGFNGADMTNLTDEVQELSALRSVKTGIKEIVQYDFDMALEKITSSVQSKDLQRLEQWQEENG